MNLDEPTLAKWAWTLKIDESVYLLYRRRRIQSVLVFSIWATSASSIKFQGSAHSLSPDFRCRSLTP
jgi:hypothetical protein